MISGLDVGNKTYLFEITGPIVGFPFLKTWSIFCIYWSNMFEILFRTF